MQSAVGSKQTCNYPHNCRLYLCGNLWTRLDNNIIKKANNTIAFLPRNISTSSHRIKSVMCFTTLVRHHLKYYYCVLSHGNTTPWLVDILRQLKTVSRKAARTSWAITEHPAVEWQNDYFKNKTKQKTKANHSNDQHLTKEGSKLNNSLTMLCKIVKQPVEVASRQ